MSDHILDLSEAYALDAVTVGGKARNLSLVGRLLPELVPPGFVIRADACDDMQLESEVRKSYATLSRKAGGRLAVAVRSSAGIEDGSRTSCAGLLHTELEVSGPHELLAAIRRVRAAAKAPGISRFLRHRGVAATPESTAVLVMPMVASVVNGVAYTRDPVTGDNSIIVEAVAGRAGSLIAGPGAVDRYRLTDISGVDVVEVGPGGRPLLSRRCLERLGVAIREVVRNLEDSLGRGLDVEFAIDEREDLHLLQVRPIADAPALRTCGSPPQREPDIDLSAGLLCSKGTATGPLAYHGRDGTSGRVAPGAIVLVDCLRKPFFLSGNFARAAGVIARQGSLLDHGATLLRELGIPAVVGVGGAADLVARHLERIAFLDATRLGVYFEASPRAVKRPIGAAPAEPRHSTKDDLVLSRGDKIVRHRTTRWIQRPPHPQPPLQNELRRRAYSLLELLLQTPLLTLPHPRKGFLVRLSDFERMRDALYTLPKQDLERLRCLRRSSTESLLASVSATSPPPLGAVTEAYVSLIAFSQLGGFTCECAARTLEERCAELGIPLGMVPSLLSGRYTSELAVRRRDYENLIRWVRNARVNPFLLRQGFAWGLTRRNPEIWSAVLEFLATYRTGTSDLRRPVSPRPLLRAMANDLRNADHRSARPPANDDVVAASEARCGLSDPQWKELDHLLDTAAWESYMADSEHEFIFRTEYYLRRRIAGAARQTGVSYQSLLALSYKDFLAAVGKSSDF